MTESPPPLFLASRVWSLCTGIPTSSLIPRTIMVQCRWFLYQIICEVLSVRRMFVATSSAARRRRGMVPISTWPSPIAAYTLVPFALPQVHQSSSRPARTNTRVSAPTTSNEGGPTTVAGGWCEEPGVWPRAAPLVECASPVEASATGDTYSTSGSCAEENAGAALAILIEMASAGLLRFRSRWSSCEEDTSG